MSKFFLETVPLLPVELQVEIFARFLILGILGYIVFYFIDICSPYPGHSRKGFKLVSGITAVSLFVGGIFAIGMTISYGVLMASRFNWSSLLFMIMWLYCILPAFVLAFLIFPELPRPDREHDDYDDNVGPGPVD